MLRDGAIDTNDNTWTGDGKRHTWRDIDRELRALAKRRGRLDAEEAHLLCSVARIEVWRELGNASLLEYLEEVLGYGPRAASERVRVAIALDELPDLAEALASGELSYSAIREITRARTCARSNKWCPSARRATSRPIGRRRSYAHASCASRSGRRPSRYCVRSSRCWPTNAAACSTTTLWSPRCATRCSPVAERTTRARSFKS